MRFIVIVKATKDSENEGAPPDPQLMADMNKFNDERRNSAGKKLPRSNGSQRS